jgi:hypothetical protein
VIDELFIMSEQIQAYPTGSSDFVALDEKGIGNADTLGMNHGTSLTHAASQQPDGGEDSQPTPPVVTKSQRAAAWFLTDVLVFIVVLNLSAELVDQIVIDRFSISIFVALVLKVVLDVIHAAEHAIKHFFCVQRRRKILGAFFMWSILFVSKFLILWIDDVIFGSHVELGSIWVIVILSAVLMVAALAVRLVFRQLGVWDRSKEAAAAAAASNVIAVTAPTTTDPGVGQNPPSDDEPTP